MSDPKTPKYQRLILKISGESFSAPGEFGISPDELKSIAHEISLAADTGAKIAIVVGGGNMIRGASLAQNSTMHQSTADYMGMLGTVMNGMALKEALEAEGRPCRLMSAIHIPAVAEPFIRSRALRHLDKGRILILSAGTGNPFNTTDSCASLRASELNAEIILKATKVDGIYSEDPVKNPNATRYDDLTFQEAIEKQLRVMDLTALSMCLEQNIPVIVFDFKTPGNIRRAIEGQNIGTLVTN